MNSVNTVPLIASIVYILFITAFVVSGPIMLIVGSIKIHEKRQIHEQRTPENTDEFTGPIVMTAIGSLFILITLFYIANYYNDKRLKEKW